MQHAQLLTSQEVSSIHDASLEILKDVGILVRNGTAREIFTRMDVLLIQIL